MTTTVTRKITVQIDVEVEATVEWTHDPGVWRDNDGGGAGFRVGRACL